MTVPCRKCGKQMVLGMDTFDLFKLARNLNEGKNLIYDFLTEKEKKELGSLNEKIFRLLIETDRELQKLNKKHLMKKKVKKKNVQSK